jgi:Ca-activated chloride channel family protein
MTKQAERVALLQLTGQRPRNAKVFCIGVGNEVNRPLLEQLADESGGLAAFVSRSDSFERQAKAFRRKLMHPVATDLRLEFSGAEVYDVEPARLPNLYHGRPVRVYGRYRGTGTATLQLAAEIRGRPFTRQAELEFPPADRANPQIERMWAWHRIDRLLKEADRRGQRSEAVDEVVSLGESYSIVTEYTSFLVLENDAEYKRWKIERRNARRLGRDRDAGATLRESLAAIRNRAARELGPQPPAKPVDRQASARDVPVSPAAPRRSTRNNAQSWDVDFGTGPVGPLFAVLAGWMARRRKRS